VLVGADDLAGRAKRPGGVDLPVSDGRERSAS
jgi:hypothetical protein